MKRICINVRDIGDGERKAYAADINAQHFANIAGTGTELTLKALRNILGLGYAVAVKVNGIPDAILTGDFHTVAFERYLKKELPNVRDLGKELDEIGLAHFR